MNANSSTISVCELADATCPGASDERATCVTCGICKYEASTTFSMSGECDTGETGSDEEGSTLDVRPKYASSLEECN